MTLRLLLVFSLVLTTNAMAQELVLTNGTRVKGAIVKTSGNRIRLRTVASRVLSYPVYDVDFFQNVDGTRRIFAAELLEGKKKLNTSQAAALVLLSAGKKLGYINLNLLAKDCNQTLFAKLLSFVSSKNAKTRLQAAQILAIASTPRTVAAALPIALHDPSAKTRRVVCQSLMTMTAVAAIRSAKLVAEVRAGLATKDRKARFALAWIGTQLNSQPAILSLERFVSDSDHHVRETAAVLLADHGSLAGLKVLLRILGRKTSKALAANRDAPKSVQLRIQESDRNERIQICRSLGALKAKGALAVLRKLCRQTDKSVAAAAKQAVERIEESPPTKSGAP